MPQAVTELVIDTDTSGADQFSAAMDRAGASAGSAQASVAQMTLAIAGVGIAVIAAVQGLRSFYDYVGRQTQELVDMADKADLAGMSMKEFQQSLFAARASGVSDKDFFSGIDKLASDISQASQKTTEFGELFRQNGLSIKQANGELITTKQALTDIMGLMQGATPQVQQRLAQIVGVSASWIPFLKAGQDEFERLKQRAQDLGVIIDDATIVKAREFNAQWKEAVATWDLQFKASMASILPLLTQLATLASQILGGIGSVSGTVGRWLTPEGQMTSSQLNDQINDVYRLREAVEALGGSLNETTRMNSVAGFKAGNLAGSLQLPETLTTADVDRKLEELQGRYDAAAARIRVTPAPGNDTVLPNMSGGNALDKQIEQIDRHIAKMKADAEAVGEGAGALERARAEALLYDAAQKAGITDLEKYADQFYQLAERAGDAAEALARAKVGADIKFWRETAFLGPQDLQIAQQLRGAYGSVAESLNSAQASQLRFNATLRQLSDLGQDVNRGFWTEFGQNIRNGASAMQAFEQAGLSALSKIADKLAQMAADQLWQAAFGGSGGGLGGLGGLLGGGGAGLGSGSVATWSSGLGAGTGGLSFPMFAGGTESAPGGPAIVNEQGGEILNLPSGTQVIPHDVSMAMARGAAAPSGVHVQVGVTVDDDGKLQAYVKNVSQATTAQGIGAYVSSPQFVDHIGAASGKARTRRL